METMQTQLTRRRFTVQDYHRMAEAGILHEDDRVELIEGELIEMAAIGSRHFACVMELTRLLGKQLGDEVRLSIQNPVRLDEHNESQPDVAVLRAREGYFRELPRPDDVLLLIEVSDTTLAYDRNVKVPLYARLGIREVWIVDLSNDSVERHTEPSESGYRLVRRAGRGETLASEALPTLVLPVDAVLA
jgi:Uma2 family endonuclease